MRVGPPQPTGCDHERTDAIGLAAEWMLSQCRPNAQAVRNAARFSFGLSEAELCAAVEEMHTIRPMPKLR